MTASKRKAKSAAMDSIHEAVSDLYEIGLVTKVTMREFDRACLQPVPEYKAIDVKRIREKAHVSQAVFAEFMNVSVSAVQKWEAGDNTPHGPAAKLLFLVDTRGSLEALA
jgi:putative transcriptional regulator